MSNVESMEGIVGMDTSENWYVIRTDSGQCAIAHANGSDKGSLLTPDNQPVQVHPDTEQWGPFNSQAEAIARRVGLIRAGKCMPA